LIQLIENESAEQVPRTAQDFLSGIRQALDT
jgi:hypothetical protein